AVSGASSCGSNSTGGQQVLFSNAVLVPGDTLTLTISGTLAPGTTGTLANTATVIAAPGANEANPANNSATDTDTAGTPQTDLAITKTDGQTSYVPGTAISYTIAVTNAGPSTATGFSVADTVPATITGVWVTCAASGAGGCGTNASAGNAISFTGLSLDP